MITKNIFSDQCVFLRNRLATLLEKGLSDAEYQIVLANLHYCEVMCDWWSDDECLVDAATETVSTITKTTVKLEDAYKVHPPIEAQTYAAEFQKRGSIQSPNISHSISREQLL